MPKINELQEGLSIEGFYALCEVSLRDTRKGDQYVRVTLSDSSGSISGNIWRISDENYNNIQVLFNDLTSSKVVKLRAKTDSFNGTLQLNIEKIRPASDNEIKEVLTDLVPETPLDKDSLLSELLTIINSIEDDDYKALLKSFFDNKGFAEDFMRATAARSFHHAYLGGLLEHTVSIATLCDQYSKNNPAIRRDLLITGAIFHDMGKMKEMSVDTSIEYTDEGSLLGHLNIGILMLEDMIKDKLPDFPDNKKLLVYHLILSHHGEYEYGSPVLPSIPEAFALHHIDNLDAKVYAAAKAIDNDVNKDSNWTDKSYILNTRVYKG
ncbi:MAG: 3'-5' exoribonuclease YhaM family protein [Planctomycetota bacterium]|jgi:3'-5' exoribonuclease